MITKQRTALDPNDAATRTSALAVACVGAGYWGKNLVRNFNALDALASVCEPNRNLWNGIATAYPSVELTESIDHVLADPDIAAVAIATPAETHADLVDRALRADKDVFVEKPLCLSSDEGRQLVTLAAERRRILMVGHLLWYHPAILKLKQLIDEGELGRIQYIYSNRLNLGKIRREENILWSFAPHDISVILGLVGESPHDVTAQGGNYLHEQIADVTVSLLSFPSGVKAHIFVSWLHPFKEQKLIVVGDRKMAVFDDLETQDKLIVYPHAITWKNHVPIASRAEAQAIGTEPMEPLREECAHFLHCVRTRQKPRTDGDEGLRVLSVLERCQKALQTTAGPVRLRQHGDGDAVTPPVESSRAPESRLGHADTRTTTERPYLAHESAFIDTDVEIGEGTTIWHVSHVLRNSRVGKNCRIGQNVVIGPNVSVGDGVKIQNNVSVYEGVTLEDHVFCGPSMVFTNVINPRSEIGRMNELRPTLVRRGASLGANCTVMCGVTIGQYAFVGAGAVVLKEVPDFAVVVGNPGRIIGWMCQCGNRIAFDEEKGIGSCRTCNQKYWKSGMLVSPM